MERICRAATSPCIQNWQRMQTVTPRELLISVPVPNNAVNGFTQDGVVHTGPSDHHLYIRDEDMDIYAAGGAWWK